MIEVAAAVAIRDGKVLLASRPADKPPAGWEFPGGKLEPGEDVFSAVRRELREELAWDVVPEEILYTVGGDRLSVTFVRVSPAGDSEPVPCEGQQIKWVDVSGEIPEGLLRNDEEFWNFLRGRGFFGNKIK